MSQNHKSLNTLYVTLLSNHSSLLRHLYAQVRYSTNPSSISVDVKLQTQIHVTAHLEDTTQPERPGYEFSAEEEIAHLHHVTNQPIDNN